MLTKGLLIDVQVGRGVQRSRGLAPQLSDASLRLPRRSRSLDVAGLLCLQKRFRPE